ncbi:MAG: hypothetical protein JWM20_162 [Patescibacteria group bacterium]|nr:hypothetical protein [Patescibacteria group bacterium]
MWENTYDWAYMAFGFELFKKQNKKEEKIETSPSRQVESIESREAELHVIGNIRKYGSKSIRNLFIAIALVMGGAESTSSFFEPARKNKQYAYEAESRQEFEFHKQEFSSILSRDEYKKFVSLMDNHIISTHDLVTNGDYREEVISLGNEFSMTAMDLYYLSDPEIERNVMSMSIDPEIKRSIHSIATSSRGKYKLDFGALSVSKPELMKNPKHVQALERAASLGLKNVPGSLDSLERINDDAFYSSLKQIADAHDVSFDADVVYAETKKISTLNDFPNVMANIDGSTIDFALIDFAASGNSQFSAWDGALASPQNLETFKEFQKRGYSVISLLNSSFYFANTDEFFRSENTRHLYSIIADYVDRKDLANTEISSIVGTIMRFYREKNSKDYHDVNLASAEMDLKRLVPNEIVSADELEHRLKKDGIYENIFLPLVAETDSTDRLENNFMGDPALKYVRDLGYHKHSPTSLAGMSARERASWIMQTCRAMEVANAKCTPENFDSTLCSIMETRSNPEMQKMLLFKGRNVAYMANNEKMVVPVDSAHDGNRFGKKKTLESLKAQHPASMQLFRADFALTNVESQKKAFFDFVSTQKNVTILVDAHGSPDGIYFSEGVPDAKGNAQAIEGANKIGNYDIAQALIERYTKHGIRDRAVLVENACMNFQFIQGLYDRIQQYNKEFKTDVPLPYAVGVSEYGQYGFSTFENDYGNALFGDMFSNGRPVTMQDIIDIEHDGKGMLSNISIFAPHKSELYESVFKEVIDAKPAATSPSRATSHNPQEQSHSKSKIKTYHSVQEKVVREIPYQIADASNLERDTDQNNA